MAAKCAGITRAGKQCPSPPLPGSQWCWMHAPEAAEARREASRKGGRAKSTAERAKKAIPAAMDADELGGWLSLLFRQVMAGTVEPRVGTAAATIAKVLFDVKSAVDVAALEAQVAELRALVERNGRGRAA